MRERSVAETTVVVGEALEGPAVDRWRRLITDAAALRLARVDQVLEVADGKRSTATAANG